MASLTPPEKKPWRTVDEQLIDDVVQEALKEGRKKPSTCTCKVLVMVQSRELCFKLKEVLRERAKNVAVLAADHQTPLNFHLNVLKAHGIKVIIGTLTRIDDLLCANAISGIFLSTVFFVDAGILFEKTEYRRILYSIFKNVSRNTDAVVYWTEDTELKVISGWFTTLRYNNVIPYRFMNALHYYAIAPDQEHKIEAISELRKRFLDRPFVVFCHRSLIEMVNKKLRSEYRMNCILFVQQLNHQQRTSNFKQFMESPDGVLLTTSYFNGVINVHKPLVVINFYLPPVHEYTRRVVLNDDQQLIKATHFFSLIYKNEVGTFRKLMDKLGVMWTEEAPMFYSSTIKC